MTQSRAEKFVQNGATVDLWSVGSDLRKERLFHNRVYWTKDIDFKIRFRHGQEKCGRLFVGWHNVGVFSVRLARRGEMFESVRGWWSRYNSTRLLYASTLLVSSYCNGVYKNCLDDRLDVKRVDDHGFFLRCFLEWEFVSFVLSCSAWPASRRYSRCVPDRCLRRHGCAWFVWRY